jgi:RNA polymerase-binding transcription factor DksA
MNARRLEHYAMLLKQERARIAGVLAHMGDASSVAVADESGMEPGDDGIAGIIGVAQGDDAAVAVRELEALHEVEEGLRLVRESPDDYGICVRCGRPIPDERLELLPATRVCGRSTS